MRGSRSAHVREIQESLRYFNVCMMCHTKYGVLLEATHLIYSDGGTITRTALLALADVLLLQGMWIKDIYDTEL
jgi:hypothetical protein